MNFKKEMKKYLQTLEIKEGKKISLKKFDTDYAKKFFTKEQGEEILQQNLVQLAQLQDKLYAENKHSVLIVLQAMDAAGKDGVIKHVMKGFNPQGVRVTSFKAPTHLELNHDYFWRHNLALPSKGEIGIFNRSHYENVLVTRVHPEYILNEKIPGIKSLKDIDSDFWQKRFKQINRFEKTLSENGTLILKFFLHLSKEEQKKRFLDRIEKPEKNWKFSMSDANERQHWDQYMNAYQELLTATSTEHAPWYILPADDKWFTRICLGAVVSQEFEKLKLSYPKVNSDQLAEIQKAKEALLLETD